MDTRQTGRAIGARNSTSVRGKRCAIRASKNRVRSVRAARYTAREKVHREKRGFRGSRARGVHVLSLLKKTRTEGLRTPLCQRQREGWDCQRSRKRLEG